MFVRSFRISLHLEFGNPQKIKPVLSFCSQIYKSSDKKMKVNYDDIWMTSKYFSRKIYRKTNYNENTFLNRQVLYN